MNATAIVLAKRVSSKILVLRNQKIILDADLAELYGVPVKRLNEQIKRNPKRFPPDFLFTLSRAEYQNLRSQNATSSSAHGGRRYLPKAFTEHGAVMAATVLNSKRASMATTIRFKISSTPFANSSRLCLPTTAGSDSSFHHRPNLKPSL